ncbi:hypothetical protein BRADO0476 [Bradyrhizobium sp. ORS 278]|nr:hypothetical protein BRADO0476 [Bradyrhizobium sp. ORS 278]
MGILFHFPNYVFQAGRSVIAGETLYVIIDGLTRVSMSKRKRNYREQNRDKHLEHTTSSGILLVSTPKDSAASAREQPKIYVIAGVLPPPNIGAIATSVRISQCAVTCILEKAAMPDELSVFGFVDEIEIEESAAVVVEQIDEEITVSIASVVSVNFQLTPEQTMELSRALAIAAEKAAEFLASDEN